jgi:hypothetical protein
MPERCAKSWMRRLAQICFDSIALSEQHVALGGISSSAPEFVFGYLAAVTSRVKRISAFAHSLGDRQSVDLRFINRGRPENRFQDLLEEL